MAKKKQSKQQKATAKAQKATAKAQKAAKAAGVGLLGKQTPIPTLDSKKLQTPQGAIYGQQGMNEYNALLNEMMNRYGVEGPFGRSYFVTDPETGQRTMRTELNPNEQRSYDASSQANVTAGNMAGLLGGQLQNVYGQQYDISGAPQMPGQQGLEQWRQQAEQAEYQNYLNRMEPEFQQQQNQLQQQLADQGIPVGSELYNRQMQQLAQQQNDAKLQAQSTARQTFTGQMANQQQMGQNARNQFISDYERTRYAPMTEFQSFKGMNTGPNMPGSAPQSAISMGNVDVTGTGMGFKQISKMGPGVVPAAVPSGGNSGPSVGDLFSMQLSGTGQTPMPTNYNNSIFQNTGNAFSGGMLSGALMGKQKGLF